MASETSTEPEQRQPTHDKRAWEALKPPLAGWILDAVSSMGFRYMTPVQHSTIPLFMSHKDVVVEAVTGSGKTLAFLIPVIERLLHSGERTKRHHVGAIIISPTRELATQIHRVLVELLTFHPESALLAHLLLADGGGDEGKSPFRAGPVIVPQLLVGGDVSASQDLTHFLENSPNVLVSTPGRLLELLSSPHVHCSQSSFETLVLDEADRLLDLGFKEDLQSILGRLPKQRRTGLFSASVSEAVDQIVRVGLRNPVKIAVRVKGLAGDEDSRTPSSLQMRYLVVYASEKYPAVCRILSSLDRCPNKTIIYLSTCAAVDYFQHVLPSILPTRDNVSFSLVPLHGKHPPKIRQKNFTAFSDTISPSILLTTDVAARGLDISQVDLVLQIDPPSDPKVFLHRCGRAGRAGRKGLSILFLQPGREEDYVAFLSIRKTPVTLLTNPAIAFTPDDAARAALQIRQVVRADRAQHDKAQRGFVSWARAYSKHQASSIFRMEDIDWSDQGQAWGLLKLPKMPELKHWAGDKSLGVKLNWAEYGYRDRKREAVRIEAARNTSEYNPKDVTSSAHPRLKERIDKRAWSDKLNTKDERELKRDKRARKRAHEQWAQMTPGEREGQKELQGMIEQVKRQKMEEDQEGQFEGFDN